MSKVMQGTENLEASQVTTPQKSAAAATATAASEAEFWPKGPFAQWPVEILELYFSWLICEWDERVH